MDEENINKLEGPNTLIKGNWSWYNYGGKYLKIKFPSTTTTAWGIWDTASRATQVMKAQERLSKAYSFLNKALAAGNVKKIGKATKWVESAEKSLKNAQNAAPKGSWVARFDTPHPGAMFDHLNINPDVLNAGKAVGETKFVDPHLQLPPGGMQVSIGASICYFCLKVLHISFYLFSFLLICSRSELQWPSSHR